MELVCLAIPIHNIRQCMDYWERYEKIKETEERLHRWLYNNPEGEKIEKVFRREDIIRVERMKEHWGYDDLSDVYDRLSSFHRSSIDLLFTWITADTLPEDLVRITKVIQSTAHILLIAGGTGPDVTSTESYMAIKDIQATGIFADLGWV